MIPEEIFQMGGFFGLDHKDVQDVILEKFNQDATKNVKVPCSSLNTYKNGGWYGTISINDF